MEKENMKMKNWNSPEIVELNIKNTEFRGFGGPNFGGPNFGGPNFGGPSCTKPDYDKGWGNCNGNNNGSTGEDVTDFLS